MSKLNTFQLKGLRKSWDENNFCGKSEHQQQGIRKSQPIQNKQKIQGKYVKTFSDYVYTQQNKLLAHIVRSDESDPLRQCTLTAGTPYPYELFNKRVGRPRSYWTRATYERLINKNIVTVSNTLKTHPNLYIDQIVPAIKGKTIKT